MVECKDREREREGTSVRELRLIVETLQPGHENSRTVTIYPKLKNQISNKSSRQNTCNASLFFLSTLNIKIRLSRT